MEEYIKQVKEARKKNAKPANLDNSAVVENEMLREGMQKLKTRTKALEQELEYERAAPISAEALVNSNQSPAAGYPSPALQSALGELERVSGELAKVQEDLEKEKVRSRKLEEALFQERETRKNLALLQEEVNAEKEKRQLLEKEVSELRQLLEQAPIDTDDEILKLKAELYKTSREKKEVQNELAELKRQFDNLDTYNEELGGNNSRLCQEIDDISALSEEKVAQLQEELAHVRAELDRANAATEEAKSNAVSSIPRTVNLREMEPVIEAIIGRVVEQKLIELLPRLESDNKPEKKPRRFRRKKELFASTPNDARTGDSEIPFSNQWARKKNRFNLHLDVMSSAPM